MFKSITERAVFKDWRASLFLFIVIGCLHFYAAITKSLPLNFLGMSLYLIVSLTLVRRTNWKDIRIKKPIFPRYIFLGSILTILLVLFDYLSRYYTVGFSSSNFFVLMAEQQLSYGAITISNRWQYFPIAALGFSVVSPFTEEFFFRGVLLKAFELKYSATVANLIQSFLFSFIHLAYFWLTTFDLRLIIFVPLGMIGGLLFGWLVQKTDSIYTSIILHIVYNLSAIFLVYAFVIPALK